MEESAYTDNALTQMLEDWRAARNSESQWTCRLFKNDYHPVAGIAIGDLTQADFTGYSAVTMTGVWNAVSVAANVASTTRSVPVDFTVDPSFATSQIIYGYYLTDSGGALRFAVRFQSPRTLFAFDKLTVTPVARRSNPA